jgi:Zn-dependent protease with chaperone function
MHFLIICLGLLLAYLVRLISNSLTIDFQKQWSYSLFFFAFPPLVLLMTSLVILSMGYHGEMWGMKPSKISFALALSFLIWSGISLIKLSIQLQQTIKHLHQYSQLNIQGKSVRLLQTSFPYAAQIGFWQSELLVSQGLIKLLSPEHLTAVISHETAHQKHRDTFFFFWLCWLKKITFWLPNNQLLWDNLLLLRELRADHTAAEEVDFLLLAESLLMVTKSAITETQKFNYDFVCPLINYRLQERIEALIDNNRSISQLNWGNLIWLILVFIPWLTIPYHNSI